MADSARGRLTIFLGYAAGVGKTFQMLTQAQEIRHRGVDVVVAYFEPHARPETAALIEGLEVIPRQRIEYRGRVFEEMDTDAVLARHPAVAVVDEFPHTNVPGSARSKRWEDVSVLLDAGIDVWTTMNVQHVESLNDEIWQSTGVRVRETIPDWLVKQADEVVLVDLTPQALLHRLERGVVYAPERAQKALQNFFKEPTLAALRELAMRQTALAIDARRHATGTSGGFGASGAFGAQGALGLSAIAPRRAEADAQGALGLSAILSAVAPSGAKAEAPPGAEGDALGLPAVAPAGAKAGAVGLPAVAPAGVKAGAAGATAALSAPDRLLLLLTPNASSAALIRRGRRVADYLHADCAAVYVARTPDLSELSEADRDSLERQLTFARRLRIETRVLVGTDVAATLVSFARVYGATQIFVSREDGSGWKLLFGRDLIQRIVGLAPDMQVTIVANRGVRRKAPGQ